MKLNYLDLFSGIGGFALGARLAGLKFKHHYFSEIERPACSVYARHFPDARPLGDITKLNAKELGGKHEGKWIVTGGFPCQDISSAGSGRGLAGSRSGLWWQMHRVVHELRPALVVIENVAALQSAGLDRVLFSLASIGYDAEWEVISAAQVGAPHLRKRMWVVAYPHVHGREPEAHSQPADPIGSTLGQLPPADASHEGDSPWAGWQAVAASGRLRSRPAVRRVDDGVSDRLDDWRDQLKGLGNAIVPQVAEVIFKRAKHLLR